MSMCGGTGQAKDADADVQDLCETVKGFLEDKVNKKFSEFTAKQYKSQVVAGTNFFVKVHVGNEEYYHIRIFKPLPHVNGIPELVAFRDNQTLDVEIDYFA